MLNCCLKYILFLYICWMCYMVLLVLLVQAAHSNSFVMLHVNVIFVWADCAFVLRRHKTFMVVRQWQYVFCNDIQINISCWTISRFRLFLRNISCGFIFVEILHNSFALEVRLFVFNLQDAVNCCYILLKNHNCPVLQFYTFLLLYSNWWKIVFSILK